MSPRRRPVSLVEFRDRLRLDLTAPVGDTGVDPLARGIVVGVTAAATPRDGETTREREERVLVVCEELLAFVHERGAM